MYTEQPNRPVPSWLPWVIGIIGCFVGIILGLLTGSQPLIPGLIIPVIWLLIYSCKRFEWILMGWLILRSAVDGSSALQLPTIFALALDGLGIVFIISQLFKREKIHTDWFWWGFLTWWLIQGMWLVMMVLGGLGFGSEALGDSLREWIRIFSWVMAYLLMMQMKDKMDPEKTITRLFFALIVPLTVGFLQIVIPNVLPAELSLNGGDASGSLPTDEVRIRGTIGHANGFVTLTFLFIGLTIWKVQQVTDRTKILWLGLLSILAFFYVSAKALYSLMMLVVFTAVMIAPRLSLAKLIMGIIGVGTIIALFGSTEFGQERLASIAKTPLLNPDMDASRAIILARGDNNSFNWRIAQWTYLMGQFEFSPIFGYGVGTNRLISENNLEPHNDYVRALVEGGWVGFTTYIGFLLMQIIRVLELLKASANQPSRNALCLILLAISLSLPVAMLTENIWTHTLLFFMWYTVLAIAGWDWTKPPSDVQDKPPRLLGQR
jgi:O-antigen ligase